jgi:hypothetical protein
VWDAVSTWSNVAEELTASIFRVLMPKNALCFNYLYPENGASKLSGNVGKFLPMDAVTHGAQLLTTITYGR